MEISKVSLFSEKSADPWFAARKVSRHLWWGGMITGVCTAGGFRMTVKRSTSIPGRRCIERCTRPMDSRFWPTELEIPRRLSGDGPSSETGSTSQFVFNRPMETTSVPEDFYPIPTRGARIGVPFVHDDSVNWVAFSPDGRSVLTSSYDRTARMWDVATGRAISSPLVHGGAVIHADFSADGRWFATACKDGLTRLWKADHARSTKSSAELIEAAERAGGYVMNSESGRIGLYRHP